MKKSNFTFIDLFSGIGGFHLGLSSLGGMCVYANELDSHARATYESWYYPTTVDKSDIREIEIFKVIPKHDILTAGFPCQPFSLAGVSKKNSMGMSHGFQDESQGNLFQCLCKIIESKKPKVIFLENVKNLISHDHGRTWIVIQQNLESLGYTIFWQVIDAAAWVPQHRERIFIIGFRNKSFTKNEISTFKFPSKPKKKPKLSTILERNPSKKYMLSDEMWRYLKSYLKKHKQLGNGFGYGIAERHGQARTLSARYYKDGSEILIREPGWKNPRRLTPREAARLMGFDGTWRKQMGMKFPQVISDTQAYRQFGNSVCPHIVRDIGIQIFKVLELRRRRLLR